MKEIITKIKNRISKAATSCGRNPEDIKIIAVTKTVPADRILEAIESGMQIIGESYIQDARDKYLLLSSTDVSWHFIGHLQTNKAKYAVKMFDLIHTVDSYKLAVELDSQAKKINKIQQILIQVNIGKEKSKSGITEENVFDLIKNISGLKNLLVKGLMVIPPFFDDPEKSRPYFAAARLLRDKIIKSLDLEGIGNVLMDELSMGMTGDFETAIEEGATLVRIGTAIFGERK
ncbi:MAG: YggS family pyridoxal phosphate-dependent enzyme [Proteobacteria bacterium]|nr:YggS family pyridoxal phosphate-dependent enzyme [Pseudomonadota bacterium]